MKQKANLKEKPLKQKPLVALRYVAMPEITLEGLLYTDNPHGDQTRPLKDLQTLIESKISTAMQSMTNFLRARGITIARFEISTSLSYDKPPMPVKKNGKDH